MGNSCAPNGRPSGFQVEHLDNGSIHVYPSNEKFIADFSKRKQQWCVDPDGKLEIPVAEEGPASQEATTLVKLFKQCVDKRPDTAALRHENLGEGEDGFAVMTWKEYYDDAYKAAKSFVHLGLSKHECVSIIGFNSEEWFISEMGAMLAGGKAAGIYTTNSPKDCAYIVNHSESKVVVCENDKQLAKFLEVKAELTSVKALVVYKGVVPEGTSTADLPVYDWKTFLSLGEKVEDQVVEERIAGTDPSQSCLLIYTSGTTGNPKAVMISHDSVIFEIRSLYHNRMFNECHDNGELHLVSYLPLSHVAGNMVDMLFPIVYTAEMPDRNAVTTFARPDALKGTLVKTLGKVQPTFFFGVPRVWEKFMETMTKVAKENPSTGVKRILVDWAKSEGQYQFDNMSADVTDDGNLKITEAGTMGLSVTESLVLSKVWEKLGLTRCSKYCLTGAAPISKQTLEFFGQFGIHIHEVYGMSESSGATSMSDLGTRRPLCVGLPLEGTEILLQHEEGRDKANEGEICFRGRHIMLGYMKDDAKTKESIDNDGWLHSGDVGRVDAAGRLYITGRIKELIITAGGENIAPVPIEDAIKEFLPSVANAMVVGDRRKYNTVLVTLHQELDDTMMPTSKLAAMSKGIPGSEAEDIEAAMKCEAISKYIEAGIKRYNEEKALSNAAKVQYFRVLPKDFSIAGGELTPTMKLKRPVVCKMYSELIETMY